MEVDNILFFMAIWSLFLAPVIFMIGFFQIKWLRNLQKYGVQTKATVLPRNFLVLSGPLLLYSTKEGVEIQKKYPYSSSSSLMSYKEGTVWTIRYNPAKPKSVWIEGDKTPLIMGYLFIAFTAIPIIMSFMLFFVLPDLY